MTNEEANKYLCEKLGLCWHEIERTWGEYYQCSCSKHKVLYEDLLKHSNPNFSTDAGAVQLLRLMMKRVDWWRFIEEYGDRYRYYQGDQVKEDMIAVELITTSSALLDACVEWFEGQKK
jgi:hypothetical protein